MRITREEAEKLVRFIPCETFSFCLYNGCHKDAEGVTLTTSDGKMAIIAMCRPCFNLAFTLALDQSDEEE